MYKLFTLLLSGAIMSVCQAQTPTVSPTQPFGKVSKEDLEMKACDFEKDANAEILFDKAYTYIEHSPFCIATERHKRIKIFNDNGKNEANIRIEYLSASNSQYITGFDAETINLADGTVTPIKVDKKQIFTEVVDKLYSALIFSFPDVKPGSIIEYKYKLSSRSVLAFPDWYFQSDIPTRYSELNTDIPDWLVFKRLVNIHYPYVTNKTAGTKSTYALADIPSLKDEPYMDARNDNSERMLFQLLNINDSGAPGEAISLNFQDTWKKVGENILKWDDFGMQLNKKLTGEDEIIAKAKSLKTDDAKIAYIFNEVKNSIKWNDVYNQYTYDGTSKAWDKKNGNSAEVNIALYHLLKKSGLQVYPMLVSTRQHGHVNPAYPSTYQFNNTVAYIPVDSNRYYVLDASNKYNIYNQIPDNLLNSFGFYVNNANEIYDLKFLQNINPVRQVVLINADIKSDGKMSGTAELSNYGYNRVNAVQKYKTDGEKKYIEYLCDNNNNLKISSLKIQDLDVDTVPLVENINFDLDLTGSDDNYIYFNSNLFTGLKSNPFLNEKRVADVDFGYRDNYAVVGIFKMPAGYKADALPQSVSMSTPDNSIVFKRAVAEQNGSIMIRLTIDHKQSMYFKEDYPDFREFCKKMYEMLNEQVVLKKS